MITKRLIKELLEEAKAEARTAHDTRHKQGRPTCALTFDSGYHEGQKDLLEKLLKMKRVEVIIN
jgi:peptidoglycan/xylan/chitin deacetylase (PgdA/CDA1 family)